MDDNVINFNEESFKRTKMSEFFTLKFANLGHEEQVVRLASALTSIMKAHAIVTGDDALAAGIREMHDQWVDEMWEHVQQKPVLQ